MAPLHDPHNLTDPKRWTRKRIPLTGPWKPASGYMTKAGKPMWRVWNDDAQPHKAELLDARGCPRLFRTFDAAHKAAEDQNRKSAPDRHANS
jgi:hypothetical protein